MHSTRVKKHNIAPHQNSSHFLSISSETPRPTSRPLLAFSSQIERLMKKKKFVQGLIKRHPDGFGFLIPDDKTHPDVYVPRHSMSGVMSNDRVLAEVEPEKGGDRFRGEIVRVIARGVRKIVGAFKKVNESYGLVLDEGKGWGEDLRIPMSDSMNAKNGELVAAEIVKYPEPGEKFLGKVVEIIGDLEDPMNDIRRVIHGNQIPDVFPDDVLREAKGFKEVPEEKDFHGRRDLRRKNLITIDGATAKDFDDAILVETNSQGFQLYVAIADVSHYVRPGTAIDREAYQRGTSVYFPNFVVPMLPEVLSNGLCSLNPKVPRLCLVAEMQFDFTGTMLSSDFYEGVMESKARATYGQAQEIIDGQYVTELEHVKADILKAYDLAKILMAKRFRDGAVDLEIPETQLQIDGAGRPIDVIRSERLFAHRLIEEMMLAANVAVAKFLGSKDIPSLYRVHEPPNEMAIRMLEKYIASFGGKSRLVGGQLQKKLTQALADFEGKPEAPVLHILTLRSMSQAKYAKDNLGHFGLGFDFYTHFTSPIRRYPDLIVHRLLKNQILPNSNYRLMSEEDVASAGTWLSACEQRSVKAERQLMGIKKARFMQQFLGQEFEGLVSSVARFGVFVLLRQYDIDGLVRSEEMGDGRWDYDEDSLTLVAQSSGFSIRVGDTMKVIVAAAETTTGQITFVPVEATSSRKLQFASGPENRLNERSRPQERPAHGNSRGPTPHSKEKPVARGNSTQSTGKDSEKRRKGADDRERVRKARVSQPGGKNTPGPVPGGKTHSKRRRR